MLFSVLTRYFPLGQNVLFSPLTLHQVTLLCLNIQFCPLSLQIHQYFHPTHSTRNLKGNMTRHSTCQRHVRWPRCIFYSPTLYQFLFFPLPVSSLNCPRLINVSSPLTLLEDLMHFMPIKAHQMPKQLVLPYILPNL